MTFKIIRHIKQRIMSLCWDKIRILVTNKCNYRCAFCHNEGQEKGSKSQNLKTEDLKLIVNAIKNEPLSEFNFSGGEPFLHPDIVEMITYARENLKCDISCATNLSKIKDEQIEELSGLNIKFNIQFPYVNPDEFRNSTATGQIGTVISNIDKSLAAGIKVGLNTVIQSNDPNRTKQLILFGLEKEIPIKLLPQLGLDGSENFLKELMPIIKNYAIDFKDKKTGALKWTLQHNGHKTSLVYIDSPCFSKDFESCRRFGELRIHPDLTLQPCIMKDVRTRLDLNVGDYNIIEQMEKLWHSWTMC